MATATPIRQNPALQRYYTSLESRIGYSTFLGGTRHFGLYESEKSSPFPVSNALRRMEGRLYASLGLAEGAHVLDAGCGVGHVAIYLAQRGLRIFGIDLVPHHLEKARRNVKNSGLGDKIQLSLANYHDLQIFDENYFDGVYTMETFVHATDPLVALEEFNRVLKPGGRLALFEYDHSALTELSSEIDINMRMINKYAAMPANQSFEPGVLESLLSQAGFQNIRTEDISKNILPMMWLFYIIAYVPYLFVRLFRLQSHFINTMAGVEGYRGMKYHYSRYIIVTAQKPANGVLQGTREIRKRI